MALPTRSAAELNAVLTSYSEAYLNKKLTNQGFKIHPIVDHLLDSKATVGGGNEIVVPVLDPTGTLIAVLDVDATEKAAFDAVDAAALERLLGRVFAA
jgi:hypothetical protein